jgi:small-conductance mechanosensitive channel
MANRWFRTNHPQPVTLDDPRMKFALMTSMIAFLAFAALIVWFRYYVERIAQKIAVAHVQRMGVLASVVLPAVVFLQLPSEIDLHRQRVFMYSGYIVAWVIYIGYLLLLMAKLARLKREAAALAAESPSLH